MIFITAYDRPKMLLRLLKELKGERIRVIDDGSKYNPDEHLKYCDYYRVSHKGKEGFWVNWNFMLELAKESTDTEFIFLPDDIHAFDIDRMRKDYTKGCLNVLDVGLDRGWTPKGYVDCGFMCDRSVLEALEWKLEPIPIQRFNNPYISSGVGQQMSFRLWMKGIPMFLNGNYAQHGNHESKMHKEERLRNPLVC
jgi:glycosyltransferase involved in cell wall biosynthesis